MPGLGQVTLPWLPGHTVGLRVRITGRRGSPPTDTCWIQPAVFCGPLVLWLARESCLGSFQPLGSDVTELWLPKGIHTRQLHLAALTDLRFEAPSALGLLAECGWGDSSVKDACCLREGGLWGWRSWEVLSDHNNFTRS